jgi:hypothetical protein
MCAERLEGDSGSISDTLRVFPRSMQEAFPDERAYCIEIYESWWDTLRRVGWRALFN